MNLSRSRPSAGLVIAAAAALLLSACGATGAVGSSASTSAAPGASSPPADADQATEALQAAYQGVVGAPPTETVPVTPDVTAWIVSCGQVSTTCSTPSQGAVTAAEEIGWEATVCDGKLNPDGWAGCVRQGIAADAGVIITIGQDCASISGALQEARTAGATTVNVGGRDCDDPLYTSTVDLLGDYSYEEYWKKIGELQADWLIGKTDGQVKLLQIDFEDTVWGPLITQGLTERLAECSGCSVVGNVQLSNADLASGQLPQKFSTALLQATDANAVAVPIDGWFLAGLAQAINSSAQADQLNVIGNFGSVPNWEVIRSGGGQDATVATSTAWHGWAGVDAALRTLAGQEVLPAGAGLQVVDADTDLPAAGQEFTYTPAIDFVAAYGSVWEQ